ncbi:MAG: phosphodiesterase [Clostridiales bacterium]|nr:phosphodiesterase [Clostridiales bacterium]
MKFLIASDVHGSAYYLNVLLKAFEREKADKLILLGDIYNHGPRNPLPKDYAPMEVAKMLNAIKDKLIVIKGNCDSVVDTMISEFDFVEDLVLVTVDKTLFLTHGHVYNKDAMPKTHYDGVIYGHFHTGFIENINGVTVANAGSISLPKNNTPRSYITVNDGVITLKDLDGNIILEKRL